jgi:hypothetical protein
MKTNIRLLVAIAAMLAAPVLNAQSRSGHNPGGSNRPGHHATVSGSSAKPGKDAARPSGKPSGHGAITSNPSHGGTAHRPDPGYRPSHRPTPPPAAHRPSHRPTPPPVAHRPSHRPSHPVPHRHHVTVLPSHAVRRYYNGLCYYFWDNLFYRLINGAYYVCDPPVGAIVYELPANYDIITMNGIRYYRVYNTLYNLVVDAYGKPAFEVVGYLNG